MLKQKNFLEEVEKIEHGNSPLPPFLLSCSKKHVFDRKVADVLFLTDSEDDEHSSGTKNEFETRVYTKTPTSIAAPKFTSKMRVKLDMPQGLSSWLEDADFQKAGGDSPSVKRQTEINKAQQHFLLEIKAIEKLISSNDEGIDCLKGGNTRKTSYIAHKITTQEESFFSSDSDSDDLSIEECIVKKEQPKENQAAGLLLDLGNSSSDSIDRVIEEFYFQPQNQIQQTTVSH